ncbi:MAG: acyl carrier protein [Defluviitaleaceae bacterium]|nr:acyl carrier protein [Defluviitaleaceae bacterium]
MEKLIKIMDTVRSGVDYMAHTALIDDGVLDSFDIVSLIAELSDAYDIQIPAEEIVPENFNSAALLQAMINRLADNP